MKTIRDFLSQCTATSFQPILGGRQFFHPLPNPFSRWISATLQKKCTEILSFYFNFVFLFLCGSSAMVECSLGDRRVSSSIPLIATCVYVPPWVRGSGRTYPLLPEKPQAYIMASPPSMVAEYTKKNVMRNGVMGTFSSNQAQMFFKYVFTFWE